jgi:ABC-type antimicrobial peptide transport system permease subunit
LATEERIRENDRLLAAIEGLPDVRAAALWRVTFGYPARVLGLPEPQDRTVAMWLNVSPRYLEASGVRLLAGRWFAARDRAASPAVVVSERFAHRFARDPADLSSLVGRATVGPFPPSDSKDAEGPMTILGVVSDFRSGRFGIMQPDDANAAPQVFFLDALRPLPGGELLIRSSSDPLALIAPVQRIVRSGDATLVGARTLDDQLAAAVAPRTFTTGLIVAFAAMGLLLAMVGIAGVLSFAVTQRTREIGVRLALGARPFDVLRLILSEVGSLVGVGAVVGVAGCAALSNAMRGLLYGIAPTDPWAHFSVSGLMIAVALVAAYLPARTAMRVDPVRALRHE